MKTKLFFIATIFFASMGSVFGQGNPKTAEEKCEILTSKMITFYGLSTTQATEVKKVNLKFIQDDEKLRLEYKNAGDQYTVKKKALQEKYDSDILAILDANQHGVSTRWFVAISL